MSLVVAPMPHDYTTKVAIQISPWPHMTVKRVNQRVADLRNLVPELSPFISAKIHVEDLRPLVKGLEAAERAEARRGSPIMQWHYDFIRHTALRRHLQWERQLLARLHAKETA